MKIRTIQSKLWLTIAFAILLTHVKAQKLPNIQENSIWAPTNIKVDARLNDWGDLQAYNKTVQVNYTLANDDNNLYLVIKATNPDIANKIVAGGVDLTINTEGKKSASNGYVISFPFISTANASTQMGLFSSQGRGQIDSAAIVTKRKQAIKAFKEIKLTGFKDIADSIISIYNEYGIKAAIDYDEKGAMICELLIPLKYFGTSISNPEFAYNLKLNGLNIHAKMMSIMADSKPGTDMVIMSTGKGSGFYYGGEAGTSTIAYGRMPVGTANVQEMIYPTDFWGKYTLAKK